MIETLGEARTLALIGLAGGVVLGLAARLGRFCTLGAIEDALYGGDLLRLRMWGIAIATAAFGTQALLAAGLIAPSEALWLMVAWNPWASVAGGLAFGYGMALAGNCGYGALARAGGGDLRAFVIVLVLGLSAYATLSGPLAPLRIVLFPTPQAEMPQGLPWLASRLTGWPPATFGLVLAALLLALSLWRGGFSRRPGALAAGAAVGLAIVSGWAGTAWVAREGFAATTILSHTYAAPMGETLLWAMTASATPLGFGVGSVAGVALGALLGSLWQGRFRWEACDDPGELRRQLAGAALMGAGAVVALGCTIGQGVSAFSVFAYSAPVTSAAIFAGAALGLRQLIAGFAPAG